MHLVQCLAYRKHSVSGAKGEGDDGDDDTLLIRNYCNRMTSHQCPSGSPFGSLGRPGLGKPCTEWICTSIDFVFRTMWLQTLMITFRSWRLRANPLSWASTSFTQGSNCQGPGSERSPMHALSSICEQEDQFWVAFELSVSDDFGQATAGCSDASALAWEWPSQSQGLSLRCEGIKVYESALLPAEHPVQVRCRPPFETQVFKGLRERVLTPTHPIPRKTQELGAVWFHPSWLTEATPAGYSNSAARGAVLFDYSPTPTPLLSKGREEKTNVTWKFIPRLRDSLGRQVLGCK